MPAQGAPAAICILGMHRSGTSAVTRAVNLLGVHLGAPVKMMPANPENPEGYWEHLEINDFQRRLMGRLERSWDTANPLPERWLQSAAVRPFKEELAAMVSANFSGYSRWAWKEPQTCLLLPLWRELLEHDGIGLSCLFVVRNPVDVACSLMRRNAIPFEKALGIWLHYNLVALKEAAGLPIVFLSYERLLAAWEPELRRCASGLGLEWPERDEPLRQSIESFIDPSLRHYRSPPSRLRELPPPVMELYQALSEVCLRLPGHHDGLERTVERLFKEFHAYASLFQMMAVPPTPGKLVRMWRRWQVSFRKRWPIPATAPVAPAR